MRCWAKEADGDGGTTRSHAGVRPRGDGTVTGDAADCSGLDAGGGGANGLQQVLRALGWPIRCSMRAKGLPARWNWVA